MNDKTANNKQEVLQTCLLVARQSVFATSRREHFHSRSCGNITELYSYSYDHAGRLTWTGYRLNDLPKRTLSRIIYDDLGRVVLKSGIRYSWNIRSRLKKAISLPSSTGQKQDRT